MIPLGRIRFEVPDMTLNIFGEPVEPVQADRERMVLVMIETIVQLLLALALIPCGVCVIGDLQERFSR